MSRFLQIHMLTPYHPSNLNRDDLGRPKTAYLGNRLRLRISSQSLKRAWRTSSIFEDAFPENLGTRTKEMGKKVFAMLLERQVDEKKAQEWAEKIANVFGKNQKADPLQIEQLAHFCPAEEAAIQGLVSKLAETNEDPTEQDLVLLRHPETAVDIALFGRMLASNPGYNMEAAMQVAHAVTINEAAVEDDYFTAVDDLNQGDEHSGAAHLGETEFGAGVFYLYCCLNCDLLLENLGDNHALAQNTLRAFVEAACTVAPTGKQNSFASRSVAHYCLAEIGKKQPRSLASAFINPVFGSDQLKEGIDRLEDMRTKLDQAYGALSDESCIMNVLKGQGSLSDIQDFVEKSL